MGDLPKTLTVQVEITLTKREYIYLCNHSIERALNHAILVAESSTEPNYQVAIDDLTDIKPIATKLWSIAHNAIFEVLNPIPEPKDNSNER